MHRKAVPGPDPSGDRSRSRGSLALPEQPAATPQALLSLYRPDIAAALAAGDAPAYRYAQILEHLLRRPLRPFSEATSLPAGVREALLPLGVSTLALAQSTSSADGTTKLLLSARDGAFIEAVLMRYRDRVTVCISSQVGCPVGCGFCATGMMGFRRNLSTAEIIDQVLTASVLTDAEDRRVSHVVYMGMGEPMLNLGAVLGSLRVLTDPRGLGLAQRSLSVSTIGIPSGMRRLGREQPQVNLALSLHAADDRTRALLVPEPFRHGLSEILQAAWDHFDLTHRKLLVEYVLIEDVNDSLDHARRLASLLRGHVVAVNLLPWNPSPRPERHRRSRAPKVPAGSVSLPALRPSSTAAVTAFRRVLLAAHIETVVRQSKGADIQAACGQLAAQRRLDPGKP